MDNKPNVDIREAIKKNNLHQYQVADKIGITEFTFTRWLRYELPDDRKQMILAAIEELSAAC